MRDGVTYLMRFQTHRSCVGVAEEHSADVEEPQMSSHNSDKRQIRTDGGTAPSSEISNIVEEAETAEREGRFGDAEDLYRRALRLVRRRYRAGMSSPVSERDMRERHASAAQGIPTETAQRGAE